MESKISKKLLAPERV